MKVAERAKRHPECDQDMLVRKEQEVRNPSRNTEASSSGCESRPTKPARHVGSEPCDGHAGVRVEAGRQRARRCVGARTCEPHEVSLETLKVPSIQGVSEPEDYIVVHHPMAQEGDELGGVLVCGAFEEDDPATWDTRALGGEHRRPKTRETKVWAGMRHGSRRGPIRAMTRGNE